MANKKQVRKKASSGLNLVKPKTSENGASSTSEENEAGSSQVGESKKEDEYAYDSSDEEDIRNTIGNIPTNWYDEYGHIGYDLEGKKIRKGHILKEYRYRYPHIFLFEDRLIWTEYCLQVRHRFRFQWYGMDPDADADPRIRTCELWLTDPDADWHEHGIRSKILSDF